MKTLQYFALTLLTLSFLTFNSCKKDDLIPIEEEVNEVIIKENEAFAAVIPTTEVNTFLSGKITDENGNALENVTVSYKTTTVTTNSEGVFVFGAIALNAQFAVIKAGKSGYLDGFRTFTPTPNAFNTISIQLLTKGSAKSFNASSGGSVTIDSDIQLDFQANTIIYKNGDAYNGNVMVYGRYLAPTADNLSQIMPGALIGLSEDGNLNAMVSFGMLNIELEDAAGNPLEIAANKNVSFDLPAGVDAPAEIPLWHFNETYGLWIEAGKATKIGDRYSGTVNHFSTWNLDTYENGFDVDVTLQDQNGNALANQRIDVYNTSNNLLATVYTDDNGEFTLLRAPQNLVFRIVFECDFIEIAKDISSGNVTLVANLTATSAQSYTFSGQITDCDNVTYNNTFFTISNGSNNIYFGGITDNSGNYEITSVLCDINTTTTFNLNATVVFGNGTAKDTIIAAAFANNSQTLDINFCGITSDTIDDDFIIPFVDAILIQGVRDNINKPTGLITYGNIKNVDTLALQDLGISNLTGLEYFGSLQVLNLSRNLITDVFALSNLISLKKLHLSSNSFTDLSQLSNLVNLNYLSLGGNTITDLSSMPNLINLNYLSLGTNAITDVSPLSNLINLNYLSLGFNLISDISPLSSLMNLNTLNLSENSITDLSPLSSLLDLTDLNLNENSVTDVLPLTNLISLNDLNLNFNSITDITPLSNLLNLNYLGLVSNYIENVSPLCGLGNSFDGNIDLGSNPLNGANITALRICLPNATIDF